MALLTGAPRSVTVFAVRDSQVVKPTKAAFERLIERHPGDARHGARLIVARYQRVIHPAVKTHPMAVAVVPCHAQLPMLDWRALDASSKPAIAQPCRRSNGGRCSRAILSPH